ncbi:MAG TPA: glucose 1-dehydrogenase [Terriglobales bacterium]|nr:glucose 1-dehydrogenase [Terriglobales bacterium]
MKLAGKIAIITGATAGIGTAGAKLFASEGATVIAVGRNVERGNALVDDIKSNKGKAIFIRADVSKSEDVRNVVQKTVQEFGRIDILYNNAGIDVVGTVPNTTEEQWELVINTNLKSVFLMCKYTIPQMEKQGGGVIVNTASELGTVGAREMAAYCASKGGIINLTKAMAVDCAPLRIRVNCLCPGPVETPMLERIFDAASDPAQLRQAQVKGVILQRVGKPDEIAKAALFLASDDSSFNSGNILLVDGGATSWYGI